MPSQPWLQIGTLASYVFVGRPYHLQSAASLPVATGEEVDVQFLVGAAPYRALRLGGRPAEFRNSSDMLRRAVLNVAILLHGRYGVAVSRRHTAARRVTRPTPANDVIQWSRNAPFEDQYLRRRSSDRLERFVFRIPEGLEAEDRRWDRRSLSGGPCAQRRHFNARRDRSSQNS